MITTRFSTPLGSQPLYFRQAATGAPHRGWGLRNILLYPLIKHTYPFKHNECAIVDNLVLGTNPILNFLLFCYLSKEAAQHQRSANVAFFNTREVDYWAYHLLQKSSFWKELKNKPEFLQVEARDLEQYVNQALARLPMGEYNKPLIIESQGYCVQYIKRDPITGLYIIHIGEERGAHSSLQAAEGEGIAIRELSVSNTQEKKNEKTNRGVNTTAPAAASFLYEKDSNTFTDKMPLLVRQENKIKQKLGEIIHNRMNAHLSSGEGIEYFRWAKKPQGSKGNLHNSHIIIAKNIYLTNLPSSWTAIEVAECSHIESFTSTNKPEHSGNCVNSYIYFKHLLSQEGRSFGSAVKSAKDFLHLQEQTTQDFLELHQKLFDK